MIVLDTCILIFDALTPEKLSAAAKKSLDLFEKKKQLYCSDISLWEIAMLIHKKRLSPGIEAEKFIELILQSRQIEVKSINPTIADLSANLAMNHYDPADRIIIATAQYYRASLITCDQKITTYSNVSVIW